MSMFRSLKETEIECRVSIVSKNGCSLLLYKDARADMNILDETVGAFNWKREHTRDNANCIVSIWDEKKLQWVSKEDTGTESYTEKEKGLASDSFKRACFNWGIGRELYTAPFIWINQDNVKLEPKGQSFTTYDKFEVTGISYDENNAISGLTIVNANTKKVVFALNSNQKPQNTPQQTQTNQQQNTPKETKPLSEAQLTRLYTIASKKGSSKNQVIAATLSHFKISDINNLTKQQYDEVVKIYEAKPDTQKE